MKITSNLEQDLIQIYRDEMKEVGFDTSSVEDSRVTTIYHTLKSRIIPKRTRKVHIAENFLCPKDLKKGLDALIEKFEKGYDVMPHLSGSYSNIDEINKDQLLFDWNIYHFHLGDTMGEKGLIKRTGNLLFAMLTDTDVYFISIMEHKKWSNKDLIEIIHKNWPELIEKWKIDGEFTANYSSEDISKLRKININAGITLKDGSCYMGMGGGYTMNGDRSFSIIKAQNDIHNFKRLIKNLQKEDNKYFRGMSIDLLKFYQENGVDLRLRYVGNFLYVYESHSDTNIACSPHTSLKEYFEMPK